VTPTDIKTIRDGFAQIASNPDGLAAEFYARLFARDPSLTHLFRSDLKAQGRKLTAALALVVNSLDRLEGILGQIRALGLRHRDYGVEPGHYATVGAALIDTLEARLGPAFTDEARVAWATAYGILAEAMLTAPTADMRDAA
jgi:hemoglobin-like flavoprotein